MKSQQLLTKGKVLQNEVFSGPKSSHEPADKVSKQHDHAKILLLGDLRAGGPSTD
jgi:hypothetical protein